MKSQRCGKFGFGRISSGLVAVVFGATLVMAQDAAPSDAPSMRLSVVHDWSHRHILFTNGGTPERIAAAQRDPRLLHNWLYRNARTLGLGQAPQLQSEDDTDLDGRNVWGDGWGGGRNPRGPMVGVGQRTKNRRSKVDWAVSLGPQGGMPLAEAPAKYTFDINKPPDCTNDFVVYLIGGGTTAGAGAQANIVAFNNLYSGVGTSLCNRTTPTFMFSYAVGSAGSDLSPAISLDGKKIAFIETPRGGRGVLHVLTWATGAGQGTDATTGAVAPNGASSATSLDYTNVSTAGCTANPASVSNASPYVDYNTDAVYLAADNGVLYRIKGVFKGTPTIDYCVTVKANAAMTSPVYDSVSNKVFISDGQFVYAYTPGASSFSAAGSVQVSASATGITLSPMVDSVNGFVYVFSNTNNANANAIVSQMPISLASHIDTPIGPKTTGFIWVGDFDDKYFSTGPSAGSLYACGTQTAAATKPALYTISFGATGTMNTTPAMANDILINSAANPAGICSPLTSFSDGTNDRLFAGVGSYGRTTGANLMTMWNVNSRITSNLTAPTAVAVNEVGGTSGITIDNVSASPQAASIYFGTLAPSATSPCGANVFCAVKLTQSGLQ